MEVYRIAELKMAVAMMQDVIKDTPTSVKTDKVLAALEEYHKALEKKHKQLLKCVQDKWGFYP